MKKNDERGTLNAERTRVIPRSAFSVQRSPFSSRSAFSVPRSAFQSAFTLTEILIVIGIIVLLMALAVPAFNLITGGKSIEGAANQISAALGRARAQAIGLQKITGVMFYIEPRGQRRTMAIVQQTDAPATAVGAGIWLDLADADALPLPPGVSAQVFCDSTFTGAARTSDGYIGYDTYGIDAGDNNNSVNLNATPLPGARFGGLILFDGSGRLISVAYNFRCLDSAGAQTAMGKLLKPIRNTDMYPGLGAASPGQYLSGFGLILFEQDPFNTPGYTDADSKRFDPAAPAYGSLGSGNPADEFHEEKWLDENSTPLLINRFNGTLVRGQ